MSKLVKAIKEWAGIGKLVLAILTAAVAILLYLIRAETAGIRADVTTLKGDMTQVKQVLMLPPASSRTVDADKACPVHVAMKTQN